MTTDDQALDDLDRADHYLERAMARADIVGARAGELDLNGLANLGRLEAVIASTFLGLAHRAENAARADADAHLRTRLLEAAEERADIAYLEDIANPHVILHRTTDEHGEEHIGARLDRLDPTGTIIAGDRRRELLRTGETTDAEGDRWELDRP